MSNVICVSSNKQLICFQNFFGLLSRLCHGKNSKIFIHFKCPLGQHNTLSPAAFCSRATTGAVLASSKLTMRDLGISFPQNSLTASNTVHFFALQFSKFYQQMVVISWISVGLTLEQYPFLFQRVWPYGDGSCKHMLLNIGNEYFPLTVRVPMVWIKLYMCKWKSLYFTSEVRNELWLCFSMCLS